MDLIKVLLDYGLSNPLLSAVLCVCLVTWLCMRGSRGGRFPPGPRGLPLVGYFPFLGEDSFLDLIRIAKKYGDVFSLQLGSETVVVLHGPEVIREAFSKPEFLGRPPHSTLEITNPGSPFFMNDMSVWREQRKFVVHALKDLGLGKSKIEGEIQDEISHLLDVLSASNESPVDIKTPLSPSMSNNISALVFGRRLDFQDPDRIRLDSLLDQAVETLSQTDMYVYFRWAVWVPYAVKLFKIEKSIKKFAKLRDYFRKEIENHKKSLDPDNVRDLIDICLLDVKTQQKKGHDTALAEPMILSNAVDLFGAGSEPVLNSILWCLYTVTAYTDVQERIQAEIEKVIGDRSPEFVDMRSMPYTHAVILEVMRWKTIVPLNILRYTLEDTTIGGYDIPKNTIVLANFWNAHHDPRYWTEPETFRPERFLSQDGKSVVKPQAYMPFSAGRRACPGETMAYMEIFLYFTSLLQKFRMVFPDGVEPDFKAQSSINYRKVPYQVRFIHRQ